jgi:two-component system, NtrC family, response regulator HydG
MTTNGNKKTILVVDDEESFREVMKMALEPWGYQVYLAADGREALSLYRTINPDLVLSDMVMPNLDGLGMLRALKKQHPGSVVILFTAYASLANAIAAIKEGAADMLTKPVDFGRLKSQLEALLSESSDECVAVGAGARQGMFSSPSDSGTRLPESDLTLREQRPQESFHNAGFSSLPGGRLSAPGPTRRGH